MQGLYICVASGKPDNFAAASPGSLRDCFRYRPIALSLAGLTGKCPSVPFFLCPCCCMAIRWCMFARHWPQSVIQCLMDQPQARQGHITNVLPANTHLCNYSVAILLSRNCCWSDWRQKPAEIRTESNCERTTPVHSKRNNCTRD